MTHHVQHSGPFPYRPLTLGERVRYIAPQTRHRARYGQPCAIVAVTDWDALSPEQARIAYDGIARFDDRSEAQLFAGQVIALDDPRWPIVAAGPSCRIGDYVLDHQGRVVHRGASDYWRAIDRNTGTNDVWFHDIMVDGRRTGQPSYSRTEPFSEGAHIAATVVPPRRAPIDLALIAALIASMGGGYPEVSQSKEAA